MDAIVNHLPSALATGAHILRPAKAKGTSLLLHLLQSGRWEMMQAKRFLLRKRGHGYQSGKTHHQLHLKIELGTCSFFLVMASSLPVPISLPAKPVPCTKVLTREKQEDAEAWSSHYSFKSCCLLQHMGSVPSGHKFRDSNNDFTWCLLTCE